MAPAVGLFSWPCTTTDEAPGSVVAVWRQYELLFALTLRFNFSIYLVIENHQTRI